MPRYEPKHPHDWLLLALAAGCAICSTAFVLFGAEVAAGSLRALDEAVRLRTMEGRDPILLEFWSAVTFLGDKIPLTIFCVLLGWLLFPNRRWWTPLLILCAWTAATGVDWLKETYQVVRPETGQRLSRGHSFPSGHASGVAAIALFVAYVASRHRVRPLVFGIAATVLVLMVGLSRIYLDRHWASDVLGGWVVGAGLGAGFCAIYEWILRHQRQRAPRRSDPSNAGVRVS